MVSTQNVWKLFALAFGLLGLFSCARVLDPTQEEVATDRALVQAATENLIGNASFEAPDPTSSSLPAGWATARYGMNDAVFSYDESLARTGSRSVRIDVSSYTSGDAKWVFDKVPVDSSKTYFYVDYYRSTLVTKLVAAFTLASGTIEYKALGTVPASADWAWSALSIRPPAAAVSLTVYHLIAGVGSLQIDDARLALPQAPDLSSGVPNGSFEQSSDSNPNAPLGWQAASWGTNVAEFTLDETTAHSGSRSVRIDVSSYTSGDAKWVFDKVPVDSSKTYFYVDYYRSTLVTKLVAAFTLASGTIEYKALGTVPASADWAWSALSIRPPAAAVSLTVYHLIAGVGSLQIDDARLALPQVPDLSSGVANGSFEQSMDANPEAPLAWQPSSWGSNDASFTYDSGAHSGSRSARIDVSSYTSGDAKWVFEKVPVDSGKTYFYIDYYKSTLRTKVVAAYTLESGQTEYQTLGTVAPSLDWAWSAFSIEPPASAVGLTVYHLIAGVGSLQIDDVRLALPQVLDLSSGVPNGSFEQSLDSNPDVPMGWHTSVWGANLANFTYGDDGHTGRKSATVQVSSYTSGDAKWAFEPQPVIPGNYYLYSDYYSADVPSFITVAVTLANGDYSYVSLASPPASPSYTRGFGAFRAPPGAVAATVYHGLARTGTLRIDDAALSVLPNPSIVSGVPNGDLTQLAGPSVLPIAWYRNVWGTNGAVFSFSPASGTIPPSLRIDMPTHSTGEAAWYFDAQPVTPGQVYRYAELYQSNIDTKVEIEFTLDDGAQQTMQLPLALIAPAWTEYSAEIWVPARAVSARVLHILDRVGYLSLRSAAFVPATLQPFQRPLVSLTFDDGYATDYTNVLPVLQRYGINATHYVVTGLVGNSNRLTPSQIIALHALGEEVGSHSVTHPNLATLSPAALLTELADSQQFLNTLGTGPVLSIASPYGSYGTGTLSAISDHYQSHRTIDTGFNYRNRFDCHRLKVQNVFVNTTVADVSSWASHATSTNSWLILVYHDVSDSPVGAYSSRPSDFEAHVAALASAGMVFKTISQALAELEPQLASAE